MHRIKKEWHGFCSKIRTGGVRNVILRALKEHNYDRTKTAQALGINRRTLYAKIKEFGLDARLSEEEE